MSQLLVIIQIFVAQSDAHDSLPQKFLKRKLTVLTAIIFEAVRKRSRNAKPFFNLPRR